jgi:hypothetical protein
MYLYMYIIIHSIFIYILYIHWLRFRRIGHNQCTFLLVYSYYYNYLFYGFVSEERKLCTCLRVCVCTGEHIL